MQKMSGNNRRDRSRSPNHRVGRRRDNKTHDNKSHDNKNKDGGNNNSSIDNSNRPPLPPNNMISQQQQQMLMANMYAQGNMLIGGMYPNMIMPNAMMSGPMMPHGNLDLMSSSNMDMMSQAPMDISGGQSMPAIGGQSMSAMGGQPMQAMGGNSMPQMGGNSMPAMGGNSMPTMGGNSMPSMGGNSMQPMGGNSMSNSNTSMDMAMMGGMMMDTSMMGNMGMYPNGETAVFENNKELLLKNCKLTPPEPGTESPPRRPKPPGCRTIFVCGLPDSIKESVVKEIFEIFGKIHTLRLSTKNFCHIRFEKESSVDSAIAISGYHIKMFGKNNDDKSSAGWLHVDYALSRDDQNEYDRHQRQLIRVQEAELQQYSAQQQAMASRHMSPSPLHVQPFSNASMFQLSEKIKNEEHFAHSLPTLLSWLERGECSKKNSTQFYSMLQATNSHIRRLFGEKMQVEEELQECRDRVKNSIKHIIDQLEQVAKVLTAATHQRVWDHFTKPQRKNIETWQRMTQEFVMLREEFNEKFVNEDYDYNTGNMNAPKAIDMGSNEEMHNIKLENDSLKFQLEAYKNEVDVIKADAKKEMEKFKAQFIARQALQGAFNKNPPLPSPISKPPPPPPLPGDMDKVTILEAIDSKCGEAKLIGVMSAFLQVHPQGASLDYVVSYVRALFPAITQADVHRVLQKHDDVFLRSTTGVGANIEHRWSFVAFVKANQI